MNIIALSAKARCGKDTAASFIRDFKHLNATTYALAATFKEAIAKHFSDLFTHADVFGTGVDRNTAEFFIEEEDFIKRVKSIFLDYGYDLDENKIDWQGVYANGQVWTIRRIMQYVGTDVGCNQVDLMVWVKILDSELFKLDKVYDTVIITDCRQDHEMSYMRTLGANVLHIIRDTGLEDGHSTEQGLPKLPQDYVIDNNGTLEEFYAELSKFVETLKN